MYEHIAGYWLLHCHQVTHHTEGMAMVLNVGEGQHPPLPPDFPACAPFDFSEDQYDDYQSGKALAPTTIISNYPTSEDYPTSADYTTSQYDPTCPERKLKFPLLH